MEYFNIIVESNEKVTHKIIFENFVSTLVYVAYFYD